MNVICDTTGFILKKIRTTSWSLRKSKRQSFHRQTLYNQTSQNLWIQFSHTCSDSLNIPSHYSGRHLKPIRIQSIRSHRILSYTVY